MNIRKTTGETLRRFSIESLPLRAGVSAVRRVEFEEVHQDGQNVSSNTTTHQFLVYDDDLRVAHAAFTPKSASKLFLLDPELIEILPQLDDTRPTHLEASARAAGLVKHQMEAFRFPFATAQRGGPYQLFWWDKDRGWYDLDNQTLL